MPRRVVFLDRDGTINVDRGYVHRNEDWQFMPGAIEAIRELRLAGYALAIVTNQSAIAVGAYTMAEVGQLHAYMVTELARHNTTIDAIAICPHAHTAGCLCRKPRIGMAREIERQLGESIEYRASWAIGDKLHDVAFGKNLRTRTILLRSRYWKDAHSVAAPNYVCDSLPDAARFILQGQNHGQGNPH